MQYATGQKMKVGDEVVADGMRGVIVCDYGSHEFAEGYETWDVPPTLEMLGGGYLSSGVMITTAEAGMIHYLEGSGVIEHVSSQGR
jgi:hypothetical protein